MECAADVRVHQGVQSARAREPSTPISRPPRIRLVMRRSRSKRHPPDEGVVEVVQVEDHALPGVRLAGLGGRERSGAVGPEVLEVRVAHEPPLAGRPFAQRRVARQDLVEEGRAAAKEGQRRDRHPGGLVREQMGSAREAVAVDFDLASRESDGIEGQHGWR